MPEPICQFAEELRCLLRARSPEDLEHVWHDLRIDSLGWDVVTAARRRRMAFLEPVLSEVDRLLLKLLCQVRDMASGDSAAAEHVRTFRVFQLERLQNAAAAALVAQRFGVAGLSTVVADRAAPISRRYYAFLGIAERHPRDEWNLFDGFLVRGGHHAFVGAAAEALRYYPERCPAGKLVELFKAIRGYQFLRSFLGPRILQTLYVLADPRTTPLFRELLTVGHTHGDPMHCEVTRAMVMIKRFVGRIEANPKFGVLDCERAEVVVRNAASVYEWHRDVFLPVALL